MPAKGKSNSSSVSNGILGRRGVNKYQLLLLVALVVIAGLVIKLYSSAATVGNSTVSGKDYIASKWNCTGHPFLASKSNGKCVKAVQELLESAVGSHPTNAYGPQPKGVPAIDGSFGPETYNYVKKFQAKAFPSDKSQWDGQIGPKTWGKLDAIRVPGSHVNFGYAK